MAIMLDMTSTVSGHIISGHINGPNSAGTFVSTFVDTIPDHNHSGLTKDAIDESI